MKVHRKYHRHIKHTFFLAVTSFLLFVLFLFIGNIYYEKIHPLDTKVTFGVTFSNSYASFLLPDWKKTYKQMFDDLKITYLRLPAYWENIEDTEGSFNFTDIDFMITEAQKHQAKVILVLGIKQPRWPECHSPAWAKELSVVDRQKKVLIFIEKMVNKYKDNPAISGWQVENEPLLSFGSEICDPPDRVFLKSEVDLVRKIDSKHPIILTDSGELRLWVTPMKLSDILGTTLYRSVYNPLFGYFYYPLPPAFYNLKSNLVRNIFAPNNLKTILIELQTEPWSPQGVPSSSIAQQMAVFSPQDFKKNIEFAKRTGIDEIYLWGVEWWYFMALHNHPEYLDYAKSLMEKR